MADPAVEPDGEDDAIIELTGTQKSAILMMLLGEDEAAEILKNLSPREVQHLGGAMYSVQGVDQNTVNSVLDEFLSINIFDESPASFIVSSFSEERFSKCCCNFGRTISSKGSINASITCAACAESCVLGILSSAFVRIVQISASTRNSTVSVLT